MTDNQPAEYADKLERIRHQIELKYGTQVKCEIGDAPIKSRETIRGYIIAILDEAEDLRPGQYVAFTFERVRQVVSARLLFLQQIKAKNYKLRITTRKEKLYVVKV